MFGMARRLAMRELAPLALIGVLGGCVAPLVALPPPAHGRFTALDLPIDVPSSGTVAVAATPDAIVVALSPDVDAPYDEAHRARALSFTLDGTPIESMRIPSWNGAFMAHVDDHTVHVVWPGSNSEQDLSPLTRTVGATRIEHEHASTYFTMPYAALPVPGVESARYVTVHRDPVSCFTAGTTVAASTGGADARRTFAPPGATALALAPLDDGFLAVFSPTDAAASGWQRLDRDLAPIGPAGVDDAVGCELATTIGARVVASCLDVARVIDPDAGHVERVAYPTHGWPLAMAHVGSIAIVIVRTAVGFDVVEMPGGARVDAITARFDGSLVRADVRRVDVAAIDESRFVVAWTESAEGESHLRVRVYR
jgi:hypothetical protein